MTRLKTRGARTSSILIPERKARGLRGRPAAVEFVLEVEDIHLGPRGAPEFGPSALTPACLATPPDLQPRFRRAILPAPSGRQARDAWHSWAGPKYRRRPIKRIRCYERTRRPLLTLAYLNPAAAEAARKLILEALAEAKFVG